MEARTEPQQTEEVTADMLNLKQYRKDRENLETLEALRRILKYTPDDDELKNLRSIV